jgi:hypothetical protein
VLCSFTPDYHGRGLVPSSTGLAAVAVLDLGGKIPAARIREGMGKPMNCYVLIPFIGYQLGARVKR